MRLVISVLSVIFCAGSGFGQEQAEGKIKSVNVKELTLVLVKANGTEVPCELVKGTSVVFDKKELKLASLTVGQTVTVTFNNKLRVVETVQLKGTVVPEQVPEFVKLTEVSSAKQSALCSWPSEDGLTVYFLSNLEGGQRSAMKMSRKSPETNFRDKTTLLNATDLTVTGDELEIYAGSASGLLFSERKSNSDEFGRMKKVAAFAGKNLAAVSISSDGLTLYADLVDGMKSSVVRATRPSRNKAWGDLTTVEVPDGLDLHHVSTSRNGKLAFGCLFSRLGTNKGSSLVVMRLDSTGLKLSEPRVVTVDGMSEIKGLFPRFCDVTSELFLTEQLGTKAPYSYGLAVLKNFSVELSSSKLK